MKRIVYGLSSSLKEGAVRLGGLGVKVQSRNAKYFDADSCEDCDEVHILAGTPAAQRDAVLAVYGARRPDIPVIVEGAEPSTDLTPTLNESPSPDQAPSPQPSLDELLEAAVEALFGRARSKGLSKEALRQAVQERGVEAVAVELGVESSDELKAMIEARK